MEQVQVVYHASWLENGVLELVQAYIQLELHWSTTADVSVHRARSHEFLNCPQ